MELSLREILDSYNDQSPLAESYTIPAAWYVDERVAHIERQHVFGGTWQVVARVDHVVKIIGAVEIVGVGADLRKPSGLRALLTAIFALSTMSAATTQLRSLRKPQAMPRCFAVPITAGVMVSTAA